MCKRDRHPAFSHHDEKISGKLNINLPFCHITWSRCMLGHAILTITQKEFSWKFSPVKYSVKSNRYSHIIYGVFLKKKECKNNWVKKIQKCAHKKNCFIPISKYKDYLWAGLLCFNWKNFHDNHFFGTKFHENRHFLA